LQLILSATQAILSATYFFLKINIAALRFKEARKNKEDRAVSARHSPDRGEFAEALSARSKFLILWRRFGSFKKRLLGARASR
jgi:hypothetical protein